MPLAPDVEGDATVLGHAVLGDVHVRHDLQAGGDRAGDGLRARRDVVEHPVDAVADAQVGLGGLDVDVRGPLVEGLEDEEVDVADDRGRLGGGLDVVDRGLAGCPLDAERGLHGHVGGVAAGERAVDVGADLGPGGDDHDEVAADDGPQVVHGEHVGRVRRRHHGHPGVEGDHDDVVVPGGRLGDDPGHRRVDAHGVEVDELQTHLLGHPPHQVGLGDQLLVGQDPGDALPREVVLLERQAHGLDGHPPALDEGLGQRREPGEELAVGDRRHGVLIVEVGHGLRHQVGGVGVRGDRRFDGGHPVDAVLERTGQIGELVVGHRVIGRPVVRSRLGRRGERRDRRGQVHRRQLRSRDRRRLLEVGDGLVEGIVGCGDLGGEVTERRGDRGQRTTLAERHLDVLVDLLGRGDHRDEVPAQTARIESTARRSSGSAVATTGVPNLRLTATTRWRRESSTGRIAAAVGSTP